VGPRDDIISAQERDDDPGDQGIEDGHRLSVAASRLHLP